MRHARLAAVMVGTSLLCSPLPASAQVEPPAEGNAGTSITEKELERLAVAFEGVRGIFLQLRQDLQFVDNPIRREELKREANRQMVEAVRQEGMRVRRFHGLIQEINADTELRLRFRQVHDELHGGARNVR